MKSLVVITLFHFPSDLTMKMTNLPLLDITFMHLSKVIGYNMVVRYTLTYRHDLYNAPSQSLILTQDVEGVTYHLIQPPKVYYEVVL